MKNSIHQLTDKIKNYREKTNKGYVLILTVLVISAASLVITLSLSKLLIDKLILQSSLEESSSALAVAESCSEEGLEKLRNAWQNYSNLSLSIDGNLCTINITTNIVQATLTSSGTSGNYTKRINLIVDRNLQVISWNQL